MSINGFFGRFETDKTDRLFRNLGYSTAEMADALGVSPLELKTQAKWLEKGTILELPDGRQYYFDFTYTGQVFTEIKRE